jgi:predicted DNA-binding transcriptional regulator YafY
VSARGKTTSRLIRLISLLEQNPAGLSISEIENRLKEEKHICNRRTIYRDFKVIERSYFPVVAGKRGPKKVWKFFRNETSQKKLNLTSFELFGFYSALKINTVKSQLHQTALLRFLEKVRTTFSQQIEKELKLFEETFPIEENRLMKGLSEEGQRILFGATHEGYDISITTTTGSSFQISVESIQMTHQGCKVNGSKPECLTRLELDLSEIEKVERAG